MRFFVDGPRPQTASYFLEAGSLKHTSFEEMTAIWPKAMLRLSAEKAAGSTEVRATANS